MYGGGGGGGLFCATVLYPQMLDRERERELPGRGEELLIDRLLVGRDPGGKEIGGKRELQIRVKRNQKV